MEFIQNMGGFHARVSMPTSSSCQVYSSRWKLQKEGKGIQADTAISSPTQLPLHAWKLITPKKPKMTLKGSLESALKDCVVNPPELSQFAWNRPP
jgi:hypothetical protein